MKEKFRLKGGLFFAMTRAAYLSRNGSYRTYNVLGTCVLLDGTCADGGLRI